MNGKAINNNNIETSSVKDNKLNIDDINKVATKSNNVSEKIRQKLFNIPFSNKSLLYSPNKSHDIADNNEKDKIDSNNISTQWQMLSNRIKADDLQLLCEEGTPFNQYEVDQLESAIERLKENRLEKRKSTKKQLESKKNKLEYIRGKKGLSTTEKEIIKKLEDKGLPITKENIVKISNVMEMAIVIPNITDKEASYLLQNDLSFTINNLYKSMHIGNKDNNFANKSNSIIPKELLDQINIRIEEAELELNDENINNANWLVKQDIPLTKENLWKLKDINLIKEEMNLDKILNRLIDSLSEGTILENTDLSLVSYKSLNSIINDFNNIESKELDYIERKYLQNNDIDLSLQQLKSVIEEYNIKDVNFDENKANFENINIETVSLRRNLEEIRLKLTLESGKQIINNGFNLETDKLSKIVEALRSIEDSYYNNLLKESNITVNNKNLSTLKISIDGFDRLKDMPASILASTFYMMETQTAKGLLEESSKHIVNKGLVNKSYETLMTKPDRNYGDNIEKAFINIEDILGGLNLDNTRENSRAIRILGYNEIDINIENINNIKAYDSQVNYMLKSINPWLVTSFIKKGINPLDVPISDLNRLIKDYTSNLEYMEEEKFSKYLWKLERNHLISQKEKESYIGIYRLVNQLYKSGEAALGALVKSGQDITLNNLLTAIRTLNYGGVDITVDKEFGMLENISAKSDKIDNQINEGYINSIYENIAPERLHKIHDQNFNNISLESLSKKLAETPTDNGLDHQYYMSKLTEMEKTINSNAIVIKYLENLEIPVNLDNISAATKQFSQGNSFYNEWKKLTEEKQFTKLDRQGEINIDALSQQIIDSFNSQKELNSTYNSIEKSIKDRLKHLLEHEVITSREATNLVKLSKDISFIKLLSEKEYYQVPIDTGEIVTNVNLTILRNNDEKGRVKIYIPSKNLGYVTINFQIQNKEFTGNITCNSLDSLNRLKSEKENLLYRLKQRGLECKNIYYSLERNNKYIGTINTKVTSNSFKLQNLKHNIQKKGRSNDNKEDDIEDKSLVETSFLYAISKELLIYIKNIETR